jgi:hypothetical protein
VVIQVSWWEIIIFVLVVIVAIWGFASMVGVQTRNLTRRTSRRAEDLYDANADSPRQQRRYARQHGGSWRDEDE